MFADTFESDSQEITPADYDRLNEYCLRFSENCHLPGMAVSIFSSDSLLFSGEYGTCQSRNDRFFIGSESKSFTALAIMQLVEDGLISLDDDISFYIPKYRSGKTLTIRMLLNQVSGFTQYQRPSEREITDNYGTYQYSNANYDILGDIIETVSGQEYSQYIQNHIFTPLGMTSSSADADTAVQLGMIGGYRNFFGVNIKGPNIIPNETSWFHEPAGYIASTPADMTKYLQMFLRGGISADRKRLLSEEGIRQMYTNTVSQSSGNSSYGFGLMVFPDNGMTKVYHNGLSEEYRTYFLFIPENNIAVSVLINGEDYLVGNRLTQDICDSIYSIFIGEAPTEIEKSRYILGHLLTNIKYLALLAVAFVYFLHILKIKSENRKKRTSAPKQYLYNTIGGVVLGSAILTLPSLLSGTPLWVIKDYVPDFFLIIILSALIVTIGLIMSLLSMYVKSSSPAPTR